MILTDLQSVELAWPAEAMLHVVDHGADPRGPDVQRARQLLRRGVRGGEDCTRPDGRAGMSLAGLSQCVDGLGGREIVHDDARRDLYQVVQAVFSAYLAAFPAELAGCTFDLYPGGR